MLELQNICYRVSTPEGELDILRDISITIPDQRLMVFTGPNGGGKTTLAKIIMGLVQPTSGRILYNGQDVTPLSITDRARLGISYGFQQPPRFKGITVHDLLRLAAGKEKLTKDQCCAYLTKVGLCANDYLDREVDVSLSGGEVKRIEIATILARRGSLMIFDEPEAGIDLWSFARLTETFEQIHREHQAAMIIISHQERIIQLADEIAVIAGGRIAHRGTTEEILPLILADTLGGCPVRGGPFMITEIDAKLLEKIADLTGKPAGAFNIRKDMGCEARQSTEHIAIDPRADGKPGIDIHFKAGTKGETCHIPVIISQTGMSDMVYNDFYVADDCDVNIVAGCGIHNSGCDESRHDGVHTFHIGRNCRVHYTEKHYGEDAQGETGKNVMNPQTIVYLGENSTMQMDTVQIRGIDSTLRDTRFYCEAGSEVVVTERLLTHGDQTAESDMTIELNGRDARGRVISRSVAQDGSRQVFRPVMVGNSQCFGHVQCDSIIMGAAHIQSVPAITANCPDAQLIHEAAIGKIAGDQLLKLETLGLTPEEAEETILKGFLA